MVLAVTVRYILSSVIKIRATPLGVVVTTKKKIPTFAESRGVDAAASALRDEKRSL